MLCVIAVTQSPGLPSPPSWLTMASNRSGATNGTLMTNPVPPYVLGHVDENSRSEILSSNQTLPVRCMLPIPGVPRSAQTLNPPALRVPPEMWK